MSIKNQSNKATLFYDTNPDTPTLTQLINDLTNLRDTVGASGSALLTVIVAEDGNGVSHNITVVKNPALVFEWDASV